MDYGRNVIGNTGVPLEVAASGRPEFKHVGITLDWSTVLAVGAANAIAAPTGAPTLGQAGTGGSLGAATYYVVYTFKNAQGETTRSPEASIVVGSGSTNKLTVTGAALPTGATGINVYVSTASGAEVFAATSSTNTVDITASPSGGAVAPSGNNGTAVPSAAQTIQPEGLLIPVGTKYLPLGQVLCEITSLPTQTATITGSPGGGTFTLSGYLPDTGAFVTTAAIAYNATGADVQAALRAVFGSTPITVSGSAGGPYIVTAPVALMTATGSFTGGSSPAIAVASTTTVANTGMYGPYDPAATDGRQTLTNGQCGILNTTVLQNGILGTFTTLSTNHPPLIIGGAVWQPRVRAVASGASLAGGPTWSALLAALPRLQPVGI